MRLIKEVLRWGIDVLKDKTESARLDAEILLAYALKKPVTFLLSHDDSAISRLAVYRYTRLIHQRQKGVPVAYLRGFKEFYGLDFVVNKDVLVPRPDTEILVEKAVEYLKNYKLGITNYELNRVLLIDVGTGSGCIPISILKFVPGIEAVAVDISAKALRVACKNAKKHGVLDRITFIRSDLMTALFPSCYEDYDLIVTANLPYVPAGHPVTRSVEFEPSMAVYAGADGLDLYRRFAAQTLAFNPRAIFLELMDFQVDAMRELFSPYNLETIENLSGLVRVLKLT